MTVRWPAPLLASACFLAACDVVWTNTAWTAAQIEGQGVPAEAIVVRAPHRESADPGPIERDWTRLHIALRRQGLGAQGRAAAAGRLARVRRLDGPTPT